ncbi:NAD(P)/FAD-dependent oxidoreductase [Vibrio sp. JC009]|uniref:NAD(P)/FAD-dependent oxidoreductase n=1 Tax=Vibrio sp. JC009 TaxID=2912314 RepID=UPI0023AFF3FA|nr:FAD/NAD(P)-binding oxidoreductase [Vibrio sp. JC009]WED21229.1 NAD(P)/FAD-dependent oxidoreductase [Vibrio sp. JC009]
MDKKIVDYLQVLDRRRFLKLGVGAGLLTMLPYEKAAAEKYFTSASILIIGAGAAGISIANRLNNSLDGAKITIAGARIPHLYQPGLTLVASGVWHKSRVITQTKEWLPDNVNWVAKDAQEFDPDNKRVTLTDGQILNYDLLIIATGCQLNYDQIEGMSTDLIGKNGIGSVYAGPDAAANTNNMLTQFIHKGQGKAIFTLANTPIKCAGAPLKLTFTSLDRFEQSGKRKNMDVSFVSPYKNRVFSVPFYNEFVLNRWKEQKLDFMDERVLTGIDAGNRTATFTFPDASTKTQEFDFIHVVPPMSAPDAIRNSELVWQSGKMAGNWVEVDQYTMQHLRYPEIFAAGDVAGIPFGKTAASVKKQVPVVEANVLSFLADKDLSAKFDGYTSCPLITAIGKAMLAEFGYGGELMPSFPFISPKEESWVVWIMKEKMLQPAYYAMLDGKV